MVARDIRRTGNTKCTAERVARKFGQVLQRLSTELTSKFKQREASAGAAMESVGKSGQQQQAAAAAVDPSSEEQDGGAAPDLEQQIMDAAEAAGASRTTICSAAASLLESVLEQVQPLASSTAGAAAEMEAAAEHEEGVQAAVAEAWQAPPRVTVARYMSQDDEQPRPHPYEEQYGSLGHLKARAYQLKEAAGTARTSSELLGQACQALRPQLERAQGSAVEASLHEIASHLHPVVRQLLLSGKVDVAVATRALTALDAVSRLFSSGHVQLASRGFSELRAAARYRGQLAVHLARTRQPFAQPPPAAPTGPILWWEW
jgi:hypothetical protein